MDVEVLPDPRAVAILAAADPAIPAGRVHAGRATLLLDAVAAAALAPPPRRAR